MSNGEFEMRSEPTEQHMDLIVNPLPEKKNASLEEQATNWEIAKENPIMDVPHIDFILRDRPVIIEDYVQVTYTQNLKLLMVRSHIHVEFRCQN